jgi:hypothetical protein
MGKPPEFFINHNPEGTKVPFKKGIGEMVGGIQRMYFPILFTNR